MKLGSGNTKYKFKFKYIDTGIVSIKYMYADNYSEAKKLFDTEYQNYNIELLEEE